MLEDQTAQRIDPADHGSSLSGIELAALFGISVGAAPDEVAARLEGQDIQGTGAEIEQVIVKLQERGLLRALPAPPELRYAPTERGRQLLRGLIGQVAVVRSLQEERDQVERLRTDLLSTISHELRTPLTLIRTSIGLLLDSEPDEEMRLRLLRNIKQSTERMNALITDLLDLARLQQDRLDLSVRSIDVLDLVVGAVSLMCPLLDARDQRVEVTTSAPAVEVPGDPRRLERVLLNLLGNANKFAPEGTVIRIAVQEDEHEATIAVQDAGPGIAAEAFPHLFDQFFTDRTSSSEHNIGAGLGLPIAKGIVEAHGGRIWVESTVGAGTTVSFALPRVLPQEIPDEGPGR